VKLACIIAAAFALLLFSPAGFSQNSRTDAAAGAQAPALPFTLIILGTRSAEDVEAIRGPLQQQEEVVRLTPSSASQGRLEFTGEFRGTAEALITDVRGLAVDRYDVARAGDAARGFTLTLRKIRGVPSEK
jgi:hypothetical protein